jgi:hypothetical protein
MKVNRFSEYNLHGNLTQDFLNSFDSIIKESDQSSYKNAAKKLISNLKLNNNLLLTFDSALTNFYPVVNSLMKNMNIDSFNLDEQSIVLLALSSLSIIYIEEVKYNSSDEELKLRKDSKSMLEELKMRGFGNNIVKKLILCIKAIKNIFLIFSKRANIKVFGVIDMISESIFKPIINAVYYVTDKYDLNLDTFVQNFSTLSSNIAKNGINDIMNKIKDEVPLNKAQIDAEIGNKVSDIDSPIQKFSTFNKNKEELIKERK